MSGFGGSSPRSVLRQAVQPTPPLQAPQRDRVAPDSFERLLIRLSLVPANAMAPLVRRARHEGVSLLRLITANGLVPEEDLYGALATYHDLPFLARASQDFRPSIRPSEISSCLANGWIRLKDRRGRSLIAAAPSNTSSTTMRHFGSGPGLEPFDAITTPSSIRRWIVRHHGDLLLDRAISSLSQEAPEMSAERRLTSAQAIVLLALAAGIGGAALAAPMQLVAGFVLGLASLLFLSLAVQRLVMLGIEINIPRHRPPPLDLPDRDLPVYTLLIPLYREAHMVAQIVTAVLDLDYPRAKLDAKLILESDDKETREAVRALDLPGCIDVIIVPAEFPRTKPKALNYALAFARGEYVTIYDAEDLPDPRQLRKALATFRARGRRIACLQSRLTVRSTRGGWLNRQFAIEYASLFDVIVPSLDRLGQPLMLGGTSNHFRMDVLREIGGWDPFNVTEDADIGIRLCRCGYRAGWLNTETIEEAPGTLSNWFGQRTRWLRGWIRTYLVHMRQPARLARELGFAKFLSLQVMLIGIIASAFAHPFFVAHLLLAGATGSLFVTDGTPLNDTFLLISAINLLVGYGVVMEVAVLGLYRQRRADLLASILLAPFYWLLISFAAYAALARFVVAPFKWEKTRHRGFAAQLRQRRRRNRVAARPTQRSASSLSPPR